MQMFHHCPSSLKLKLLFLLGFFLGGCAQASELQKALGSEPRALNPSCPAILGDVDWLGNRTFMKATILELTAVPFTARLGFQSESGVTLEDRWLTISDPNALDCANAAYWSNGGYCLNNMAEVEACITAQFPGITLEPAGLPAGIPTVIPNAPSSAPATTQQSQPALSIPQVLAYHWEKPNGERVEFKTLEEAKTALANSWEGGKILMETRLPNLTGGYTSLGFAELEGSYVAPFSAPPGTNLVSPNQPYFKAVEQNMFFNTLEEALAYAQNQNGVTTINQMVRGVDYGVAQQVSEFQPINARDPLGKEVLIDASTPYIQLTMHTGEGVKQTSYYTKDNKEAALRVAYSLPYLSTVDLYKRGTLLQNIETIEAWSPPSSLIAAFGGSYSDLSIPYWVFMPITANATPTYFKSKELAVEFGESFIEQPCIFPGGLVTQFVRATPKTDPVQILPWSCPEGLPSDWDSKNTYYERSGKVFPTLKKAINYDIFRWYLGYKRDEIDQLRRGVVQEEPKVNWWAPWQLIVLGAVLLVKFIVSLRNQPKVLVESAAYARHKFGRVIGTVFQWSSNALLVLAIVYTIQYVLQVYGPLTFVLIFIAVSVVVLLFFSFAGIFLRKNYVNKENHNDTEN